MLKIAPVMQLSMWTILMNTNGDGLENRGRNRIQERKPEVDASGKLFGYLHSV